MKRPRILVFSKYYAPGYAAGGSMRTIVNLVECFGDEFAFSVITNDRIRGENKPYAGITTGIWSQVGKARVVYLSPELRSLKVYARLLRETPHDAVFLNGLFSSIPMLFLRRLGRVPRRSWLLAPRGELDPGAMHAKRYRKIAFLRLARLAGLARGLLWQATHEQERERIADWFPVGESFIAPDLPTPPGADFPEARRRVKAAGAARLVFVSRIEAKKNLEFALDCVAELKGNVEFSIVGPIGDEKVWRRCQQKIEKMPPNISVSYLGLIEHEEVPRTFAESDCFLFPTKGENFGYVVLEALSSGCPVLLSDQTPWRKLEAPGIGWDIPLDRGDLFTEKLQAIVDMGAGTHEVLREAAIRYAERYLAESPSIAANESMLNAICRR